ncbi:DUF3050 domain-containing protein [Marichromatium gracile]|uniref:DUF3050 family protein n=1 Tax=Marichromatium gracile TaxID=1048 RepID=A0A4R4A7M8_MARGR|nr:DUF3050 domain-containing protein [Marichromatium gracile]MBK1709868.1 heme oxygenase [Marichromatium gracile]TCW34847.1 DUF3050 family protein [Marichromatium gracile]
MASPDLDHLRPLRQQLEQHPVYAAIDDLGRLRTFMQHHVYSVWDFMSLIKYLQRQLAPTDLPWQPQGDPALRYFINQLVLEEESDVLESTAAAPLYASHFELYCRAMTEVGADPEPARRFVARLAREPLDALLYDPELVPLPARYFTETTFGFIREGKPHLAAAALAHGRETLIPMLFRRLLEDMAITPEQAPIFHAYLQRHIELDSDFHGPLSIRLLEVLCDDDPRRIEEAETAAEEALCARIRLWDGVYEALGATPPLRPRRDCSQAAR